MVTAVIVDGEDSLGDTECCELVEGSGVDCFSCSTVDVKREALLVIEYRAVEVCFVVEEDKVVWVRPAVDVFRVVNLKLTGGETVSFVVYPGLGTTVDLIDSEVEGDRFLEVTWVGWVGSISVELSVLEYVVDC